MIRSRWPGPHASVLMRAAYAAEDAGDIERALALMNAALDELDPKDCSGAHRSPAAESAYGCESDEWRRCRAATGSSSACSPTMLMPSSGPGCWRCLLGAPCFREIRSRESKSPDRPSMPQQPADSDSITANAWITLGISLAAAGHEEEGT